MNESPLPLNEAKTVKPIVLVGNPNVGKSVIFGYLTGKYVNVSNYPGTTVEISRGKINLDSVSVPVIDTPGTNSFISQSEDEEVTRNVLLEGDYGTVVHITDSKNLRRSLPLTIQLAEMGIPFILVQNMADEAKSRGAFIDYPLLEKIFGVPVLSTTATQRKGLPQLKRMLRKPRESHFKFKYPAVIENGISKMIDILPESPISKRSIALMLLAGDQSLSKWISGHLSGEQIRLINSIINEAQTETEDPLANIIADSRLKKTDEIMTDVFTIKSYLKIPVSKSIGKWVMHPVWGVGVVLLILYISYWFVGLIGAGLFVDFFETVLFSQYINPAFINLFDSVSPFEHTHVIETIEWNFSIPLSPSHVIDTGINLSRTVVTPEYTIPDSVSLGLFASILKFIHDIMIGPYGVITVALTYGFAIVLPLVGTFFILFSILEDSGYLPRLAVMLNRIFKVIGLNGKAILPMVLGLGCDTMATMTTRIMETRKERVIITLLLALGIPCSAQLGVLLGMMSQVSLYGTLIWFFIVVGVLLSVGYLASKIMPGDSSAFILEIPPIRLPQLGNILIKTLARMEWYFKEVIPLFILGTLTLFMLDFTGLLDVIREAGSPLIETFLGLPKEITEAFLIGFLRRDYGAVYLLDAANNGLLTVNQIVISMITITLFVPCIANVFIIIKELGVKVAVKVVCIVFPLAFAVGGFLNFLLNFFNITL